MGAYKESPGTSPDESGRAYVFSGRDGTPLLELASPNEEEDGYFGYSLGKSGDVNHDGLPDVIVGAFREDPGDSPRDAGRAYIIFTPNP